MFSKSLKDTQEILGSACVNPAPVQIAGAETDSRKVLPGQLFVPLIGARSDGHDYIEMAAERGAAAALWQKDHTPYPKTIPLLLVDDPLAALQKLARAWLEEVDPFVIAVTGSNGKTTTKDFFASVFSEGFATNKTQGNRNSEIGLPLTLLEMDEDTQVEVLEMGMENFGEIQTLCDIAQPDIAVITSIGSAHMENLGSKKNIARAKLEIAENLKPGGTLYYAAASPEIAEVLEEMKLEGIEKVAYGPGTAYDVTGLFPAENGLSFTVSFADTRFELPLIGQVQAQNALPVILAGLKKGLSEEQIARGLKNTVPAGNRSALFRVKKARVLDDSYKSNPESAAAAIDALLTMPEKKHVAVLADMLDLGPQELELHRAIGEKALADGVDLVLCTGPLSKETAKGAGARGRWFETMEELKEALLPLVEEECAILIKGSHAMAMNELAQALGDIND